MVARWGPAEDAKLVKLWRTPRNGVDYTKLDISSVKAVHQKYFPERNYNTFAPRYREKAREFAVSQTLDGHRKRSAKAKEDAKKNTAGVNLEDISDDEEDPYEEEEDDNEDEEEDDEDDEEEELDEDNMPAKKTPPRKKKASSAPPTPEPPTTKTAAATVDEVADQFQALNLRKKMYCMDYQLPYMIYLYPEGEDTMCKIEVLAPVLPQSCFKPDIINGGSALEIKIQVPDVFVDPGRTLLVNERKKGFNVNTAEAQAYKATCEAIDEDNGFADTLFGRNPQLIPLPFKVEERLVAWECAAYENEYDEINDNLGLQFHIAVTIITRKQRAKKRTEGGFRVVRSSTGRAGGASSGGGVGGSGSGDANMGESEE